MPQLKSFDRVAHLYDATRGLPPTAEAVVADGLAHLLEGAGARSLLDLGVGTGRIAVPLAARGYPAVGVDISPGMLAVLRAKGSNVQPLLAEATRLPFRDGAFDATLLVHILHLVPDMEAALAETIRVVRPGGLLLSCATTHNRTAVTVAGEVVRAVVNEVTGRPSGHVSSDVVSAAFDRLVAARGGRISEVPLAVWHETTTAREELDELARRVHSHMWSIPDEHLDAVVAAATPRVIDAMGGLDNPVTSLATFTVFAVTLVG
jgi:ubiquinone/menaquinone biosynthesis C-methylase UbiE